MKEAIAIPTRLIDKCEDFLRHAFPDHSAVIETYADMLTDRAEHPNVVDLLERGLGKHLPANSLAPKRGTPTERAAAEEMIKLLNVPSKSR